MTTLTDDTITKSSAGIGGKARNLLELEKIGANVPRWTVIPEDVLLSQLPTWSSKEEMGDEFEHLTVPASVLSHIQEAFGDQYNSKSFAVRSSAIDEDSAEFSFAGQFETYLNVPFSDLDNKVLSIWKSAVSDRVLAYREEHHLPFRYGIGVLIQEMVFPDVSGVGFGVDPVSGDRNTKVISAVYGLGEGLVSGLLDADSFRITPEGIQSNLVHKTHALVRNKKGHGIKKVAVPTEAADQPTLTDAKLYEVAELLDKLTDQLGLPQDIEFAYQGDTLYLLQTRPITTLERSEKQEYTVWDNSNIVESYPGITTPMTFSFILKMYEAVYRQFVNIMGVKSREINQHAAVFAQMLGLVRGRVYYNLLSWYRMLAMLPGYSLNAENMERMMGVKERFELDEKYKMSKGLATVRIAEMVLKMMVMMLRLPSDRRRFMHQLNVILAQYECIDFNQPTPAEIINHYLTLERTLLLKWKAPLVNDFFSMIWFGMLARLTAQYCPEDPNIHNDLLCGSQDIISVEPIHMSMDIAVLVAKNEQSKQLFQDYAPDEIWNRLCDGDYPEIKEAIDHYLARFGERCVGELKLESISYSQKPSLFVKIIKSYIQQDITKRIGQDNIEETVRTAAEAKLASTLRGQPLKRWWFNVVLRQTRDLVSNRENLRYERTRGFGMVRKMLTALGHHWHEEGHIGEPRDIFYLELEEITSASDGAFDPAWAGKIEERKNEFAEYRSQPPPQERFYTYGQDFSDEYIYSLEKVAEGQEQLTGIGCCPGKVHANVQVVRDPHEIESLNGDILVTSNTDPGWVMLFPTASAVIVERGSLLSHSAIVCREMGIPCIVSVTGLLRSLKTGDEIMMDGSSGKIIRVNHG